MSSLNVVSQASNALVPVGREFSKKRRRTSSVRGSSRVRSAMSNLNRRMNSGLTRYLSVRGTPSGSYEIPRTIAYEASYDANGFVVGAARYEAIGFDFSPLGIGVTHGPGGSRMTQNFASSSEFSAIFDKCKIQKVDITIQCPTLSASGLAAGVPTMLIAEDDNDVANTISWDYITQMNCDSWNPGMNTSEWKGQIKPKFQQVVYYTSLISSYQPQRGYVVADTGIPHYGLKTAIKYQGGAGVIRFVFKVHFAFKEPK